MFDLFSRSWQNAVPSDEFVNIRCFAMICKRATAKIVGVALPASGQRQKSLALRYPPAGNGKNRWCCVARATGNGQCTGNGQRIRKNRFYFLYLNSFFSNRYLAVYD